MDKAAFKMTVQAGGGEVHAQAEITPAQWADLRKIISNEPTAKEAELQAEVDRLKGWRFIRHPGGALGVAQEISEDEQSYFEVKQGRSVAEDVLHRLVSALAPAEGA